MTSRGREAGYPRADPGVRYERTGLLPRVERQTMNGWDALMVRRTTANRIDAAPWLCVRTAAA